MNNFTLANANSINLNFLIYVNNLYINYKESQDCRFPWLPIENKLLLNGREFDLEIKNLWNHIFNEISKSENSNEDIIEIDIKYWANNKFPFNTLFNMNASEAKTYENIKRSFESWYWGTGNQMNDIFSDDLIEDYYDKLNDMAELNGTNLKDSRFYLQVVYDQPSRDWKLKNEKMIIISPNILLPSTNEIFDICKKDN